MSARIWFFVAMLVGGLSAVAWAVLRVQLPPADFTFVNESEMKSVDPAVITGLPEGRIAWSLFEGLTRPDPETFKPSRAWPNGGTSPRTDAFTRFTCGRTPAGRTATR